MFLHEAIEQKVIYYNTFSTFLSFIITKKSNVCNVSEKVCNLANETIFGDLSFQHGQDKK